MEIQADLVIVGAGIAGLATALALHRNGIRSLVLERSDELRATGAALSLFPNAWLALDSLGISEQLSSIYTPFTSQKVTNIAKGTVQQFFYGGKDAYMTGPRTLHRSTLLEILDKELPVDTIRFSSKLTSIETHKHQGKSMATLNLQDGTIINAKVVIGCDGVHSVVGRWLGLKAPTHSGRFAARGLSVFPEGHGMKHEIQQVVDGGTRVGFAPLSGTEIYWFVTYRSTPDDEEITRKGPESIHKSVLENMANFSPLVLNILGRCDLSTLTGAPLMFRVPWNLLLSPMCKDNITVAGDALHPMTPDLGQGGCAALEDAIVLGRHIANSFAANGEIDARALEGYIDERKWRAALLISASYLSGWVQQGGSGWMKDFLRDKVFYRFFRHLTKNVIHYNCGTLPVLLVVKEATTKKLE